MKQTFFSTFLTIFIGSLFLSSTAARVNAAGDKEADFKVVVVGAGPAGILTIGAFEDLGIPSNQIAWIDPEFKCGDLSKYPNVPANAKTKMFIEVLNSCKSFNPCRDTPAMERLLACDPEKEYPLETIIGPLQDITTCLRKNLVSYQAKVTQLTFDAENNIWNVQMGEQTITGHIVVLATGSSPRSLAYGNLPEIPFSQAIDPKVLPALVTEKDTIALVGSGHSAILILMFLSQLPVERIINFYLNPIVYPIKLEDGTIINDNTGLMGVTAEWAKNVLELHPPLNILRLKNTQENLDTYLPQCTKIIYAIGFERNPLPLIPNVNYNDYNGTTGEIYHNLYGVGIAFPELTGKDWTGKIEKAVGLPDFIDYIQRIVPQWIHRDMRSNWEQFASLFIITRL